MSIDYETVLREIYPADMGATNPMNEITDEEILGILDREIRAAKLLKLMVEAVRAHGDNLPPKDAKRILLSMVGRMAESAATGVSALGYIAELRLNKGTRH